MPLLHNRIPQRFLNLFLLPLAFFIMQTHADGTLPTTSPESVGISSQRLTRVESVLDRYVAEGRASGIVTVISRSGRIVHRSAVGTMGINDARPMRKDSLFRIMSMTKAVTAVAALILYEEGHFQLYDPVARYLPAFADMNVFDGSSLQTAENEITLQQLFTHTAGLSYGYPDDHRVFDLVPKPAGSHANLTEMANDIAKLPLLYEPGTNWQYSYATDVLGAVIESISGQSLGEFMRTRIFEPLQMKDTRYRVGKAELDRLTTAHRWEAEKESMQIISGPPYEAPYRYTEIDAGGAGLISTADDYLRFLEMLRRGGRLGEAHILSPKTVDYMTLDHLPCRLTNENYGEKLNPMLGKGGSHGLGIGIYLDPIRRGVLSSPGELEWGGAYGTIYWWDPIEDIIVVSMLQLARSPWQLRLRDDLSVAIYQALDKINKKEANVYSSYACRD